MNGLSAGNLIWAVAGLALIGLMVLVGREVYESIYQNTIRKFFG